MQLRTSIEYADPSPIPVKVTLTGSLEGFERLERAISKSDIPLYEVDDFVYQLREASRALRRQTTVSDHAPRKMLEGDL